MENQYKINAEYVKNVEKLAQAVLNLQELLVTYIKEREAQRGTPLEERLAIMTNMLSQQKVSQTAIESNSDAGRLTNNSSFGARLRVFVRA